MGMAKKAKTQLKKTRMEFMRVFVPLYFI